MERANQGVLRWYGHVLRMNDNRLTKKVFKSEVVGNRRRGKPKWRWVDGVKELLIAKGISMDEGNRLTRDRITWRRIVHGKFRQGLQLIEQPGT